MAELRQPLKLLVVADEEPPAGAEELVSANAPDAVVTLGDLPAGWLRGLRAADVPVIGVHGNHDEEGDLAAAGIRDLHLERFELGGWSFAGFEGSPRLLGRTISSTARTRRGPWRAGCRPPTCSCATPRPPG